MRYLLDTNIVSYFLKGINEALTTRMARELKAQEVAISSITRAELRFGMEMMDAKDKRRKRITLLLNNLPALPWTAQAADRFGTIKAQLQRKGKPIGEFDTQIGAHALAEGLILVTHNTLHFEHIAGLKLEDWMV